MKAIAFTEHGDLDVLKKMDLPDPKLLDDEALIQVEACALNHLDIWTRQGWPGLEVPMPHILVCEVVGTIVALGKKVSGWKEGERVLVSPGQIPGDPTPGYEGRESLDPKYQVMGFQRQGGYAEFTTAPAKELIRINDAWTAVEWAATPLVFLTAQHMLFGRASLKSGEKVLIHAAGSGIGTAAIQLAKNAGAFIIATASTDEKLERAKLLGADEVINYKRHPEFHKEVKKMTNGSGVDVVFEHIGPTTWHSSSASLARGGRVVFCGSSSGPTVEIDLRFAFTRQLSILGSYMGYKSELLEVINLLKQKKVHPVIDSVFPIDEARSAQEKMLSRDLFGKIVLKMV
ncbi:MAG: alcohol dehydrogenase [Deltaproteobacteria bacterium RIFCSPLOWO2_02_FULL_44_10]|nr:MAG: alcohol dehydrogenase [Deltaproteobacteria bacterium RIFCSPLOWO2_02_FULL_44_10]